MGNFNDIYIYVPGANEIIRIAEGTGENLCTEDLLEGYVDYIMYERHELDADLPLYDGGQVMYTELVQEKYSCLADAISDVLEEAYGVQYEYIRLNRGIKEVINAVDRALGKYDSENVDVVRNEENGMLDVIYHSNNNSFAIEVGIANFTDVDIKALEAELDSRDVGHVW